MFKFNSGNGAIVCDKCQTIMRSGISMDGYVKFRMKQNRPDGLDVCISCRMEELEETKRDVASFVNLVNFKENTHG